MAVCVCVYVGMGGWVGGWVCMRACRAPRDLAKELETTVRSLVRPSLARRPRARALARLTIYFEQEH